MEQCSHGLSAVQLPSSFSTRIYRDECCYCFTNSLDEGGVAVCLACYHGGCAQHALLHYDKTGHSLVYWHRRRKADDDETEPPAKLKRVEVTAEKEPKYISSGSVQCLQCDQNLDSSIIPAACIQAILNPSQSAEHKAKVQAWKEADEVACEHTRQLKQDEMPLTAVSGCCSECGISSGLWKCLTCGQQGCGRRQWDGSGGAGHGLAHYEATKHPVAVKLGTIQPDGSADVYCYVCDEMRFDPNLPAHLRHLGIDIQSTLKTEQSMAEMQLERNLSFDFAMHSADGKDYPPVSDRSGLRNLGNSCYLASAVQSLLPRLPLSENHQQQCQRDPASCLFCQMLKLKESLGHGTPLSPWMFRSVVSTGHAEFASNRQQDAAEFIDHWLSCIQRQDPNALNETLRWDQQVQIRCPQGHTRVTRESGLLFPVNFAACLEERVRQGKDGEGQVSLVDCMELTMASEHLEGAKCEKCGESPLEKTMQFVKLPPLLVIPLARHVIRNWVPQKLDEAILVPKSLSLNAFMASEVLPIDNSEQDISEAVEQLCAMGFSASAARKALNACRQDVEAAVAWLFDGNGQDNVDPVSLTMLMDAGFSQADAEEALSACDGSLERAFEHLLSRPPPTVAVSTVIEPTGAYHLNGFISHRGPSLHCGHYIACILDDKGQWLLCNDERVVALPTADAMALAKQAYIFIYAHE